MISVALTLAAALAHPIGYSTVNLDVDRVGIDVVLDLHARTLVDVLPGTDGDGDQELSLTEASALGRTLVAYVPAHLELRAGTVPCAVSTVGAPRLAGRERLLLTARARCDTTLADTLVVHSDLLMEDEGGHTLITRVRTPLDYHQLVLDPGHLDAALPLGARAPAAVLPPPPDDLPVGTATPPAPARAWTDVSLAATVVAGLAGLLRARTRARA